ncbi:hypothetical protein QE152_g14313 [Popillia japonica]|uniref:Uncharacterized protein n=1 Tax=Popillia japonica TaxID=7064 RepID=A0AAW1LAM5_POPJA
MAKDLYDVVNGTDKQPLGGAELIAKWKFRDAKAQEALVMRMEEGPLAHIMQCFFACEMWKKLESNYYRQSVVSKHLLNEQFDNVKFDADVLLQGNICAKIKEQVDEIPEKMVMTKIVVLLPERFKYFGAAWKSVSSDKQDINHLTSRLLLLVEDDRIRKSKEETVALVCMKFERKCYSC